MLTVTISYDSASQTVNVAAANSKSAPVAITCTFTDGEFEIMTTPDFISLGSGTQYPGSPIAKVNDSEVTVQSDYMDYLNIGGPIIGGDTEPTTDTYDTVTLGNINLAGLNVSAATINFQAETENGADDLTLQSVNSLTFRTTGVPYKGTMTIHAPIPTGQPFAGDAYITGPDWGAYGYAPGDQVTVTDSSKV